MVTTSGLDALPGLLTALTTTGHRAGHPAGHRTGHRAGQRVSPGLDVLRSLQSAVPCDVVKFDDFVSAQSLPWLVTTTEGYRHEGTEPTTMDLEYFRLYWQSHSSHIERSGDRETVTLGSDFLSHRQWTTSPMTSYLRSLGPVVPWHMIVPLPSAPGHVRRVSFLRLDGTDFTESERALATLIRPHLANHLRRLDLAASGGQPLTGRQRQLMELVAEGYSNRQVARTLGITDATVRTHLHQTYARLDVRNRTEALRALDIAHSDMARSGSPAPRTVDTST